MASDRFEGMARAISYGLMLGFFLSSMKDHLRALRWMLWYFLTTDVLDSAIRQEKEKEIKIGKEERKTVFIFGWHIYVHGKIQKNVQTIRIMNLARSLDKMLIYEIKSVSIYWQQTARQWN